MPEKLVAHRFRSIGKNLISELINGEIYFSDPKLFNDPYDCRIDLAASFDRAMKTASSTMATAIQSYPREELQRYQVIAESLGVACFTSDLLAPLMWSYYANGHKGISLTYEIPEGFILSGHPHILGWRSVIYENDSIKDYILSIEELRSGLIPSEHIEEIIFRAITAKSTAWSHEKEFRIIVSSPGPVRIERSWIKQVCFGLLTPQKDKQLISEILRHHGYDETTLLEIARSDDHDFGFIARQIEVK